MGARTRKTASGIPDQGGKVPPMERAKAALGRMGLPLACLGAAATAALAFAGWRGNAVPALAVALVILGVALHVHGLRRGGRY